MAVSSAQIVELLWSSIRNDENISKNVKLLTELLASALTLSDHGSSSLSDGGHTFLNLLSVHLDSVGVEHLSYVEYVVLQPRKG